MDETAISEYITATFEGTEAFTYAGATFFFYDPDRKFPFATIVTADDEYDHFSNLNRPGVFRLNIGVGKETFRSLFGPQPFTEADVSNYDFTVLDKILPHPVYGKMYWVSILNPSATTFQTVVQPLLAEAYNLDVNKHAKNRSRTAED